jgi:hypothetical protein
MRYVDSGINTSLLLLHCLCSVFTTHHFLCFYYTLTQILILYVTLTKQLNKRKLKTAVAVIFFAKPKLKHDITNETELNIYKSVIFP